MGTWTVDNSVYVPDNVSMITELLTLSECFCAASGIAETTLSSRMFNDGKRLSAVRSGKDIGARRLERAIYWLSENWPEGTKWPEAISRPLTPKLFDATFPSVSEAAE